MIGHNRIGAGAYTSDKYAIVQEAKRDCAWYKNEIKRLATAITQNATQYRKAVKDFKESGTWKEEFKTWKKASEEVLELSPQRSNQLIRELTENYYEESESPLSVSAKLPPAEHIKEKTPEPEVKEEEPEKPAVHSADEKVPATNGHKPRDNGKPKSQLAIWNEIETSIGRSLNRADNLNRLCPDRRFHAQFIEQSKACMWTLTQWRESVK